MTLEVSSIDEQIEEGELPRNVALKCSNGCFRRILSKQRALHLLGGRCSQCGSYVSLEAVSKEDGNWEEW